MSFSVIIPAFNAQETIAEAITSVLEQTIAPAEVIVVDDGSTDETVQIASAFGGVVSVVSQPNQGPAVATNAGIAKSSQPIIAGLDADDKWLPEKMEIQLAHLRGADKPIISATHARQFRHNVPDTGDGIVRASPSRSTMVFDRATFDMVGPITAPANKGGDMIDWFAKAREKGFDVDVLPDVLMLRRIIDGSLSYGMSDELKSDFLQVAREALLRKRAKKGANS